MSCRPLYVTVVYQGKCSHCMRVGVAVPLSGTVSRLRQAVAQETKIPAQQVPPPLGHFTAVILSKIRGFQKYVLLKARRDVREMRIRCYY